MSETQEASPAVKNQGTPRTVLTFMSPGKLADILLNWERDVKKAKEVKPFIDGVMEDLELEQKVRGDFKRQIEKQCGFDRIFSKIRTVTFDQFGPKGERINE